jgi:hypothetical protein
MESKGERAMTKKAIIDPATRAIVLARHNCCVVCGTWDADECGHIIAEANGGDATEGNLVRMCGRCNRVQGKKNVAFRGFASYTIKPAVVMSRRAAWAAYLQRGEHGLIGRMAKPFRPV